MIVNYNLVCLDKFNNTIKFWYSTTLCAYMTVFYTFKHWLHLVCLHKGNNTCMMVLYDLWFLHVPESNTTYILFLNVPVDLHMGNTTYSYILLHFDIDLYTHMIEILNTFWFWFSEILHTVC